MFKVGDYVSLDKNGHLFPTKDYSYESTGRICSISNNLADMILGEAKFAIKLPSIKYDIFEDLINSKVM